MFKKAITITGCLFYMVTPVHSLTLTWDAVTTYTDNTPVESVTYSVYKDGQPILDTSGKPVVTPNTTVAVSTAIGNYTVRAVSPLGLESDDSNVVTVRKPNKVTVKSATR